MFCPACGTEQLPGTTFCNVCGFELPKELKDLDNNSQIMNSDTGIHQMQYPNQMTNPNMGNMQQYPNQMPIDMPMQQYPNQMQMGMPMQQYPNQIPNQQININITTNESKKTSKNKLLATILALFLGGFGIHKFYLGKPFWGILYLLFFWTGIPGLVAFIEAICYICTSDDNWDKKY